MICLLLSTEPLHLDSLADSFVKLNVGFVAQLYDECESLLKKIVRYPFAFTADDQVIGFTILGSRIATHREHSALESSTFADLRTETEAAIVFGLQVRVLAIYFFVALLIMVDYIGQILSSYKAERHLYPKVV
jgi:hypothetical protein